MGNARPTIDYQALFDEWSSYKNAETSIEVGQLIDEHQIQPFDAISFIAFCYGYEAAFLNEGEADKVNGAASILPAEAEEKKANLEIPGSEAQDLEYWDSFPLSTKEEFLAAYEELEDINHHNGCAYLTAKYTKNKDIMQIILYISAIHSIFGSLPHELDRLRYELTNPLYKEIVGRE